ncbi:MAG TPA: hemerythrin domain-containing protein [Smithellaceae bacterium]|mgnify:CR=1 FL=1|nr:hemerythrin domain-containing protein [Smithellaceae bacterium]HPE07570.1 hemerythrin domain-containing protein [Smithellaceae bacterium]HRY38433.1 hemerythrin domain-containing protein [Smithellaceae bacterium]
MKPRGLLMIEHRLIEKVLSVAKQKAISMTDMDYNPIFIETIVDFIKTYADRTHHGKEEDILFLELAKKKLDADNLRIMDELIDEHKQTRAKVKEVIELNEKYKGGDRKVVPMIVDGIVWLAGFYPVHIKKEDAVFFPNTEKYFDTSELDNLLNNFYEFDRNMIHEKYQNVYKAISR